MSGFGDGEEGALDFFDAWRTIRVLVWLRARHRAELCGSKKRGIGVVGGIVVLMMSSELWCSAKSKLLVEWIERRRVYGSRDVVKGKLPEAKIEKGSVQHPRFPNFYPEYNCIFISLL